MESFKRVKRVKRVKRKQSDTNKRMTKKKSAVKRKKFAQMKQIIKKNEEHDKSLSPKRTSTSLKRTSAFERKSPVKRGEVLRKKQPASGNGRNGFVWPYLEHNMNRKPCSTLQNRFIATVYTGVPFPRTYVFLLDSFPLIALFLFSYAFHFYWTLSCDHALLSHVSPVYCTLSF